MYLNQLSETTPITNDEVPPYQAVKSVPASQIPPTSLVQFVINLEDEDGQEFYVNTQDELSPLTSGPCNPKLIDTNTLQSLIDTVRLDYAATFLVYALTQDEFCQRRAELKTLGGHHQHRN